MSTPAVAHISEDPKARLLARIDGRFCADVLSERASLTFLLSELADAIEGTPMTGADILAAGALITDMRTLLARADHLAGAATRRIAA